MQNALQAVKIVVSFTTSPRRLLRCEPMFQSLLNQTRLPDAIVLNLPPRFDRTGEEYPPEEALPDWLRRGARVEIHRCDRDWGPATKLVPTVARLQSKSPRAIVITVDDDIRYPRGAIAALAEAALGNRAPEVWGAAGFDFGPARLHAVGGHGRCCAVLEGYAGVAYPMNVFGSDFLSYMQRAVEDKDLRFSDDLLVSNYLAMHQVKKRLLASVDYSEAILWDSGSVLAYGDEDDALHHGAGVSVNNRARYQLALAKLAAEDRLYLPVG